jgi:hypothetical protein
MTAKGKWAPKSLLQQIFVKRVREEMAKQSLNALALSERIGAPAYRTIHDVLAGRDPRLETVAGIATALGKPAHELLREDTDVGDRRQNVSTLPVYPAILQQSQKPYRVKKDRDRRKARR